MSCTSGNKPAALAQTLALYPNDRPVRNYDTPPLAPPPSYDRSGVMSNQPAALRATLKEANERPRMRPGTSGVSERWAETSKIYEVSVKSSESEGGRAVPAALKETLAESISARSDRPKARQYIVDGLCAERDGKYAEAFDMYTKAGTVFSAIVDKGVKKSEERRVDKLMLGLTIERRSVLGDVARGREGREGKMGPLAPPLPDEVSWEREKENFLGRGVVLLTNIESRQWHSLASALPSLENVQVDLDSAPYLTPLLPQPSELPDVDYHVYSDLQYRSMRCYLHVRDASKLQTLYTMYATRPPRVQIIHASFHRAAEYEKTLASVVYTPIREVGKHRDLSSAMINSMTGRPVMISIADLRTSIMVQPDRHEKEWSPRRFTYGGRRFVWKDVGPHNEELFEVKTESTVEGSRTGKREDITFGRPLAWVRGTIAVGKACQLSTVGGLDQMFREFVLLSALTKEMVMQFGHY